MWKSKWLGENRTSRENASFLYVCCKVDITGASIINLSDDKKQTIREHFPNADAVAVIPNPEEFIEDVKRSIGTEIKAEKVNYFHIDKGYETTDGEIAMDMEYMKYLMQDASPEKVDGGIRYTFYADYAFRVLFCKDVFFEQEQEYRIVLPNETIEAGKSYPVRLSKDYEIIDLHTFFDN